MIDSLILSARFSSHQSTRISPALNSFFGGDGEIDDPTSTSPQRPLPTSPLSRRPTPSSSSPPPILVRFQDGVGGMNNCAALLFGCAAAIPAFSCSPRTATQHVLHPEVRLELRVGSKEVTSRSRTISPIVDASYAVIAQVLAHLKHFARHCFDKVGDGQTCCKFTSKLLGFYGNLPLRVILI